MGRERNIRPEMYQYGSAAPAIPSGQPGKKKIDSAEKQEFLREVRKRVNAKKKRDSVYTVKQTAVLVLITLVVFGLLSVYICETASLYKTKSSVASLQKTYQQMLQENAVKENKLSSQIDYAEVYRYAVDELEMQIPEKHQVLYYEPAAEEYVINGGVR